MSKQSSIDWLVEQIWKNEPLEHEQKVIEQAKAMHKDEIKEAWLDESAIFDSEEKAEKYYTKTFGGQDNE